MRIAPMMRRVVIIKEDCVICKKPLMRLFVLIVFNLMVYDAF